MSRHISDHPFPSNEKVQEALLVLLLDKGESLGALHARDTYAPLADFFNLDVSARTMTRAEYLGDGRNEPYWHTWVQWSKDRLLENSDIQCPKRGIWMLTNNGRQRAERIKFSLVYSFDCYSITPVTEITLKTSSEITLEDLGL